MTKSKRWDFVGIGDKEEKDGKQKFTGHPIGVGCEGDFTCNTLLYDVMTGVYDCAPCQLSTPTTTPTSPRTTESSCDLLPL